MRTHRVRVGFASLLLLAACRHAVKVPCSVVGDYETRLAYVTACLGYQVSPALPNVSLSPDHQTHGGNPCFLMAGGNMNLGFYDPNTKTILLPAGNDVGFEHESVHYLLDIFEGDSDSGHKRTDAYARCGWPK